MATFEKKFLTGSGDGTPLSVAATGTPGTLLHTVPASVVDEVWLWLSNYGSTTRTVTIELGTTATPEAIEITVAAGTVVLAIPGIPMDAALVVRAFADVANSVSAFGYANRIT